MISDSEIWEKLNSRERQKTIYEKYTNNHSESIKRRSPTATG